MHDSNVKGVHDTYPRQFEEAHGQKCADVKGEHHHTNPLVEGSRHNTDIEGEHNISNNFHDVSNNVSNVGEGSELDEIFKEAPFDFDPAYLPMDR